MCVSLMKLEFSRITFEKNCKVPNFKKIPPVENELFLAHVRPVMSKLIVAFRIFEKAPIKTCEDSIRVLNIILAINTFILQQQNSQFPLGNGHCVCYKAETVSLTF